MVDIRSAGEYFAADIAIDIVVGHTGVAPREELAIEHRQGSWCLAQGVDGEIGFHDRADSSTCK